MRDWQWLQIIGMLCGLIGVVSASSWAHDPTDNPAWRQLGPAGAVPGVRALAVEDNAAFVLCDKGLCRVDTDGTVTRLLAPDIVGKADALMVTAEAIWLGEGGGATGGVRRMDRKSGRIDRWTCDPAVPWIERVRFDGQGGIYLYEAATIGQLHVYDTSGRFRWRVRRIYDRPITMGPPEAVVRRGSGDIYIADGENNRILIFSPDGQFKGRVLDNFCRPHGLVALPDDHLAVLCDYTERLDTPLITILDGEDIPEADWVSDERVLTPLKPVFFQYGLQYYQKLGDHPKRPPESISPLSCAALMGDLLVVGQSATGNLRAIELSAFGPGAKYPARRRKSLRQRITSNKASYTIRVGGSLDWRNTKRSITHSGYCRTPLFRVDDSYTMENTGKVPVVNPHFSVNGDYDYYSAAHIRRRIAEPDMTDLEKAFSVYNFVRSQLAGANRPTFNAGVASRYYVYDWWGIKQQIIHLTSKWNNFGSQACGCYSAYVAKFAHDFGLEARNGGVVGHCPSFVIVDGKEIYLDAIMRHSRRDPIVGLFCPLIDDRGFAGYDDITHDQYLILRVIEADERGDMAPSTAGLFGHKERHNMKPYDHKPAWLTYNDTSTMGFTLWPGMLLRPQLRGPRKDADGLHRQRSYHLRAQLRRWNLQVRNRRREGRRRRRRPGGARQGGRKHRLFAPMPSPYPDGHGAGELPPTELRRRP